MSFPPWEICSRNAIAVCSTVLMLALVMVLLLSLRGNPVVVETNLDLPMEINGMVGSEDSFPESVYQELNADKNVYRHYRSKDGRQVDLYIAYFGTAKGGRTGHSPLFCLPSQGWGVQDSREIILESSYYPHGVAVNYIYSTKGDSALITIYWYQSARTKVLSSGIKQNVQRFLGMILHNRNDGAFVRVTIDSDKEGAGEAMKLAKSFSERIVELLPSYWPVEK